MQHCWVIGFSVVRVNKWVEGWPKGWMEKAVMVGVEGENEGEREREDGGGFNLKCGKARVRKSTEQVSEQTSKASQGL